MKATDELKYEHRVIEVVLTGLEEVVRDSETAGKVDREQADKALEILRNFADKCHHSKEEKYLFKTLEKRGVAREQGPIGVMLMEHDHGRGHIRAMVEALPGAAAGEGTELKAFQQNARAYIELLRQHIQKEDTVLFAMADQVCSPEDDEQLTAAFESIERDEMGEGTHEKYHQWAHELTGQEV